jgi:hypothetical protein
MSGAKNGERKAMAYGEDSREIKPLHAKHDLRIYRKAWIVKKTTLYLSSFNKNDNVEQYS